MQFFWGEASCTRLQGSKEALEDAPVTVIDYAEVLSVKRVLEAAQAVIDQR